MGLMLSILVVCVGVIEALSCFEHFQYGVIHCATNVYETARRRSSVFLKYTSRRLKLLSENSISEYDGPVFEPIKIGYEERQAQLSEEESDNFSPIRKPKAIRISRRVKKLQKDDKIQIVKALLERPRRPPTVRSISMPELVHTEEDIELSKIINDLAIEPIEEINSETEDGNCEVLSRKFDELFSEGENPDETRESSLDDLDEDLVSDDLEHFEETKLSQVKVVCDFDDNSINEEVENDQENLLSDDLLPKQVESDQQSLISDDKTVKEDEDDLPKMILEKEKPVTGVIKTNISQKVSDKGVDYFKETLDKFSLKSGRGSLFDRSISVDFNKVPSMRINKPTAHFSEMSNDSMKLISEESISHNKLEDMILESDTPPGEVIDKTFEEIYENICDESLDATNTFEEIENILGDAFSSEGQGSPSPIPYEPDDEFIFLGEISLEGKTALSSGRTVPTIVFLKAVEQLAQLLVRDSLNLHNIKNFISENLNNLNLNEKFTSVDKRDTQTRNQPENKRESHDFTECRIPSESVQEILDVRNFTKSQEKYVSNDECLREELTKTILVKKDDSTDVRHPEMEEFEKQGFSNLEGGVTGLAMEFDKPGDVLGYLKSETVPGGTEVSKNDVGISFPELEGAITGVENSTEPFRKCDQNKRMQEIVEKDGENNKSVDKTKEEVGDEINSLLLKNKDAIVNVLEGGKPQPEKLEILMPETAPSLFEISESAVMEDIIQRETGLHQREGTATVIESKIEPLVKDNQTMETQEGIKVVLIKNTETKVVDKPLVAELEKLIENGKMNVRSEIGTQPDTASLGHSDISENDQTVISIQEPLLLLEFKKDVNFQQSKIETELITEEDKSKKVKMLEELDHKNTLPNKQLVQPLETIQEEQGLPAETEKPKDKVKSIVTVTQDKNIPGDSSIVVETMESKHKPLLAVEYKTVVESKESKKETELLPETDKNYKVEGFPPIVDEKNNSLTNKQALTDSVETFKQEMPPLGETEKPKDSVKSITAVLEDTVPHGNPNTLIETIESKREPLLAVEYKAVFQPEENKKQTQVMLGDNKRRGSTVPAADEKNNFVTNKETMLEPTEKPQQEKPIQLETEKPKDIGKSETVRQDKSHAESHVISENIPDVQPEPLHALEFKEGNNAEGKTIQEPDKSKKMKPEDSAKLERSAPVLQFHDKDGEFEENVEFQQVDNTDEKNADKSHSNRTNNTESTKTSIERKTESPRPDKQNERTQKGTKVKDQSNIAADVISNETRVIDDNMTLTPNKEEATYLIGKLEEKKPTQELQTLQQNVKVDTFLGYSDVGESIQTVETKTETVECKDGINSGENKKGKNLKQVTKMEEEMMSGDIVKQSAEPDLKFHDKPGETEDKVDFEQVGIVEGNDVEKLQVNSKNEAEPTGLGSVEKKGHSSDSENSNAHESSGATSSAPEAFWLIFSGEYTKAMSKDWHSGHFSCWQCDEALTGQRYVLRDDHPYCIKCYESVFANVCEECNKIIGIDSKDLSYKDKHWHEACFLCNKCRVSLVDKQFGSKADKIYCGNCYDAQFASRCDGCGEIFRAGTKKMEYKTRQWHEKCFCCCVCKTPIGTKSFIPREQEIYCATCYEEKFATRCVKCNKIITSGGVTYKNEPWHRECFTCTNCNTSLAGQRFTSRDEKPYCADCFGELFAKRCTACSRPITGIGGTRFISFEDRHWHNDCFICASCKTSLVGRGFITDADDIICPECAKQKLM